MTSLLTGSLTQASVDFDIRHRAQRLHQHILKDAQQHPDLTLRALEWIDRANRELSGNPLVCVPKISDATLNATCELLRDTAIRANGTLQLSTYNPNSSKSRPKYRHKPPQDAPQTPHQAPRSTNAYLPPSVAVMRPGSPIRPGSLDFLAAPSRYV
jgi:hypothetical protein